MHVWDLGKFREFPVVLRNDRNAFWVENGGSSSTDCIDLGSQHRVELDQCDGDRRWFQEGQGHLEFTVTQEQLEWWNKFIYLHKAPLTHSGPVLKSIPPPLIHTHL